jgi:hypothetical protein
MMKPVADLEEHAFQRDRRFLFRLVAFLVIGIVGALWVASHLTSPSLGTCAAELFGEGRSDERSGGGR